MSVLAISALLMSGLSTESNAVEFTIDPQAVRQTIENFGASDSWTVEPLKNWSVKDRQKIADLLFSQEKGIGLSAWRFNLGGGINHESISNPLRTADSFEVSPGVYDWKRCPGQVWMLEAAKRAGVQSFIAYAVTPPKSLTRNGLTNGTDGLGSTNLQPGKEANFAKYLADILQHFIGKGYAFTHISPLNETDFEWNGRPQRGSQEGNRASNADVIAMGRAVVDEFSKRKINARLLTPEANSPQVAYELNKGMTDKYKSAYGAFGEMLEKNPDWIKETNLVYGYHSYWADRFDQLVTNRLKLRQALDKSPGMSVWQTEYCQMTGPRGEGGWGRDLGMTLALNTARIIHYDLTIVEASAWQWWLAVSDSDYKDGLIYVDDLNKPSGTIYASKTLWALGNFSRFVRPGYQRIEVAAGTMGLKGVLASAYQDPKTGRIIVVLVNPETKSEEVKLDIPGDWNVTSYITSDRPGDDLRKLPKTSEKGTFLSPSRSVVTLVFEKQDL